MMKPKTNPTTVHRPDRRDGTPDDFVIEDVSMFRLERMTDDSWWLAVYRGDKRVSIFLNSDPIPEDRQKSLFPGIPAATTRIECEIVEDDLGLRDDSDDTE